MPGIVHESVIYGPEGEQFNTYAQSTSRSYPRAGQRWPLGTKLILQDGREYRFAECGGTNIATARLCQAEVPGANFDELAIPAAVAANDKEFNVTNGATTITANQFAEGYLNVEDADGEGHLYKIAGNDAETAGSADFEVRLAGGNGLKVAFTTTTTVGLTKNPYRDVIIHPSPPTALVLGVTPIALTANRFGWLQSWGPASVLTDGTLFIGFPVQASRTINGAVENWGLYVRTGSTGATDETAFVKLENSAGAETTLAVGEVAVDTTVDITGDIATRTSAQVGDVMEVAADTEESLIRLRIG